MVKNFYEHNGITWSPILYNPPAPSRHNQGEKAMSTNYFEMRGIQWLPAHNKYRVTLALPDSSILHLGFFKTLENAMTAQAFARMKLLPLDSEMCKFIGTFNFQKEDLK